MHYQRWSYAWKLVNNCRKGALDLRHQFEDSWLNDFPFYVINHEKEY